jgi:hypothetical protein
MIWQSEGSRMRDLFVEDGPDTHAQQHLSPDAAQEIRDAIAGRHVCPFCGSVREQDDGVCPKCSMDNTSASRQATKARIGPWYVFQTRNPAAPGMKFETLLSFVKKGRVKARSVVRGPTTHQLWRFAAHVKGLSREFGICYSCGGSIDRAAGLCSHCNRSQEAPADPDVFTEGQQPASTGATPAVVRNVGPTPMPADDIVVPPLSPAEKGETTKREESEPEDEETRLKRAEGFLSPQDLAAAFNLDFRPKGRHARAQAQQQATAIARRPASPKPKRRARWGRRIFFLLVLVGIGAGAYAYRVNPMFHAQVIAYSQQAQVWGKQGVDWGKAKWAELNKPSVKSTGAGTAAPMVSDTAALSAPASTQPSEVKTSPETQAKVKEDTVSPVTPPVKTQEQPATKPDAWDQIYGKQGGQKADGQKGDSSSSKAMGTIDDVRKLYREAIDAEANNDFATAVKKYEQIKEFSRDLWPGDLELRLTQAKRWAK